MQRSFHEIQPPYANLTSDQPLVALDLSPPVDYSRPLHAVGKGPGARRPLAPGTRGPKSVLGRSSRRSSGLFGGDAPAPTFASDAAGSRARRMPRTAARMRCPALWCRSIGKRNRLSPRLASERVAGELSITRVLAQDSEEFRGCFGLWTLASAPDGRRFAACASAGRAGSSA